MVGNGVITSHGLCALFIPYKYRGSCVWIFQEAAQLTVKTYFTEKSLEISRSKELVSIRKDSREFSSWQSRMDERSASSLQCTVKTTRRQFSVRAAMRSERVQGTAQSDSVQLISAVR
jgi:hypothetical protein